MSLEQYKDANRAELWNILQIQAQTLEEEIRKNGELEKERDEMKAYKAVFYEMYMKLLFGDNSSKINLEAHNLEQQAKGLTDYAKTQEQGLAAVWIISAASKLLKKASKLKG